jgi:hypothetical protein
MDVNLRYRTSSDLLDGFPTPKDTPVGKNPKFSSFLVDFGLQNPKYPNRTRSLTQCKNDVKLMFLVVLDVS